MLNGCQVVTNPLKNKPFFNCNMVAVRLPDGKGSVAGPCKSPRVCIVAIWVWRGPVSWVGLGARRARLLSSPSLSLNDVFTTLADPRKPRGSRPPLPALLNLTALALLSGLRSLEAIAPFGRDHGLAFRLLLGLTRLDSPSKGCLSSLFRRLDLAAYEQALTRWALARCPQLGEAIALDGKTLRGSASRGVPGVHLLAAYAPGNGGPGPTPRRGQDPRTPSGSATAGYLALARQNRHRRCHVLSERRLRQGA